VVVGHEDGQELLAAEGQHGPAVCAPCRRPD
jgi:hypothetical protein